MTINLLPQTLKSVDNEEISRFKMPEETLEIGDLNKLL